MRRTIIANCGGFWGDDPSAPRRQVEGGPIDYLVMDYLAEVTMAILQKQRARNPAAGYPADFISHLRDVLPSCVQRGIKVVTNAGGVNPLGCRAAVEALARDLNVADQVKVAIVTGDDLYPEIDQLLFSGEPLVNMDTGQALSEIRSRVLSANAYIGAGGIVKALERGANVIITGRVADAAVTLAPMMFEFGWSPNDWDRVAAGIVAGHIIECGAQCTGGNFTDWPLVKSYKRIGFPIVEAEEDGSFVVTKHPNTGGLVSVHTVAEQILYEIGPPAYLTPDVAARFDAVHLEQAGPDRVRVTDARGEPAPEKLKVSISYRAGWRAFGRLAVSGPGGPCEGEQAGRSVLGRGRRQGRVRTGAASNHRMERVPRAAGDLRARRGSGAVRGTRSGRAENQLSIRASTRSSRAGHCARRHLHRRSGPPEGVGGRRVLAGISVARCRKAASHHR